MLKDHHPSQHEFLGGTNWHTWIAWLASNKLAPPLKKWRNDLHLVRSRSFPLTVQRGQDEFHQERNFMTFWVVSAFFTTEVNECHKSDDLKDISRCLDVLFIHQWSWDPRSNHHSSPQEGQDNGACGASVKITGPKLVQILLKLSKAALNSRIVWQNCLHFFANWSSRLNKIVCKIV